LKKNTKKRPDGGKHNVGGGFADWIESLGGGWGFFFGSKPASEKNESQKAFREKGSQVKGGRLRHREKHKGLKTKSPPVRAGNQGATLGGREGKRVLESIRNISPWEFKRGGVAIGVLQEGGVVTTSWGKGGENSCKRG